MKTICLIMLLIFPVSCFGATSITISNPVDGDSEVLSRKSATNPVQDVVLTGTYSGTAPTAMDCKVNIVAGGTALAVTPMTNFTASGGNWTGTCPAIPQGAWYNAYAQDHNNTPANATQTQQFCVGLRFVVLGVSVQEQLFEQGTVNLTQSPYVKNWISEESSAWTDLLTDQAITWLNSLQSALGGTTCVGAIGTFFFGASLSLWSTSSGGTWNSQVIPSMPPSGADSEFVVTQLSGTSSDGNTGTNPDLYYPATYAQIISQVYALTGRNATNSWFGITYTGYTPGTSLINSTAVHYQQWNLGLTIPGAYIASAYPDLVTVDGLHPNPTSRFTLAERYAQGMLYQLGLSAQNAIGPVIQRFTRSGATLTFTTTQSTGTGLAFPVTPAGIPGGFYISTSNVCGVASTSPLTVSSYSIIDARHFSLTLSADPGAPVYVCYLWGGQNTQNTSYNLLFGTPNVTGSTLGNPGMLSSEGPIPENQKPNGPAKMRFL